MRISQTHNSLISDISDVGRGTEAVLLLGDINAIASDTVLERIERIIACCTKDTLLRLAQPDNMSFDPSIGRSCRSNDRKIDAQLGSGDTKHVLICGRSSVAAIRLLCRYLKRSGVHVIVLKDALEFSDLDLTAGMAQSMLEQDNIHISLSDGALYLLKAGGRYVYAYPKADNAASVVVVCASTEQTVLIRRGREPYIGRWAIPGGFIRPLAESLEECAARELCEETGLHVAPESLRLVTARSAVDRDPRGHIIDHCFLAVVSIINRQELLAGDDASGVSVIDLRQALNLNLAADHGALLKAAADSYYRTNKRHWLSMLGIPWDRVKASLKRPSFQPLA